MSTVLIRQIPDDYAENTGLSKYNRSRMPGCVDVFSPAINDDGRFLTNLDEDALHVDLEHRDEILKKRQFLESKVGKDLSGTSDFWRTFNVIISSDKPKVFDTDNPMDYISLQVLFANKNVAPTKEDAYTPAYMGAQYYAYTEESEDAEEISSRKKRDKAVSHLLSISENKNKMLLYGQYLEGLKYNESLSTDTIYKMLRAYIESKDIKNASNYLAVIEKSVEELQIKNLIDRALKQRLISKTGVGNKKQVYQYGQVTVGTNIEEVYKNLASPDFAPELLAIKKELEH